jgi:sugar lactone lactonase YvrE
MVKRELDDRHAPRRFVWRMVAALVLLLFVTSLGIAVAFTQLGGGGHVEVVWGRKGISPGRLQRPRAMAIDAQDQLYLVDMTARIQVFDRDGNYLRGWQTPASANGRPTGLTIDQDGNLLVADTHYYRVLCYTPDGQLLEDRTLGGTPGNAPGEFGLVTDADRDSAGNLYVAEYGEYDRIQKFAPDGTFLLQWGGHGQEPGQFVRPQNIAIDEQDRVWVADACNHRIQVFDASGSSAKLVKIWGEEGTELGKLRYPYDLALDGKGHVYVCEFGNHRVQKFTLDGKLVGYWALVRDSRGCTYVLDTYNHRVQRIRL